MTSKPSPRSTSFLPSRDRTGVGVVGRRLVWLLAVVTACSDPTPTAVDVDDGGMTRGTGALTSMHGAEEIYSNLGPGDTWANTNGWSGPSLCTPTDCPGSPGALSRAVSFVSSGEFLLTDLELAVSDISDPSDERPGETPFDVGIYRNQVVSGLDQPGELLGTHRITAPENRLCSPATDPDCLPFGLTPLTTLTHVSFSTPIELTGGERYWIGLHPSNPSDRIDGAWWWNHLEAAVQSRSWSTGGPEIVFEDVEVGGVWTDTNVLTEPAFRVSGTSAAFTCDTVTQIPAGECAALAAVFEATAGEGWTDGEGWMRTTEPCDWAGITCSGGSVVGMVLTDNNLTGNLPPEIADLGNLTDLRLDRNDLQGAIPLEVAQLSNLTTLSLGTNQLSGPIPSDLANLSELQVLSLDRNGLTGPIPSRTGATHQTHSACAIVQPAHRNPRGVLLRSPRPSATLSASPRSISSGPRSKGRYRRSSATSRTSSGSP